jgi:voltage-gated potassium channel
MEVRHQLILVLAVVLSMMVLGAFGFYAVGDDGITFLDALYHAVLTVTSVGYGDSFFGTTQGQKVFGLSFMLLGMMLLAITGAAFVAFFTEAQLHKAVWRTIMTTKMLFKRNHHVIIGVQSVAPHIIGEFHATKTPFCVVVKDPAVGAYLIALYKGIIIFEHPEKHLTDEIFEKVKLKHAASVTLDLGTDETNHIIADLIREKKPGIRVLSVGDDVSYAPIMSKRINHVVNPHFMCAMRLASLAKRPGVVTYLDRMLYKKDGIYRIEEVAVDRQSILMGKTLEQVDIGHQYRLVVTEIMIEDSDGNIESNYLPLPEHVIQPRTTLIVQGKIEDIEVFRDVADPVASPEQPDSST